MIPKSTLPIGMLISRCLFLSWPPEKRSALPYFNSFCKEIDPAVGDCVEKSHPFYSYPFGVTSSSGPDWPLLHCAAVSPAFSLEFSAQLSSWVTKRLLLLLLSSHPVWPRAVNPTPWRPSNIPAASWLSFVPQRSFFMHPSFHPSAMSPWLEIHTDAATHARTHVHARAHRHGSGGVSSSFISASDSASLRASPGQTHSAESVCEACVRPCF